MFSYIICFFSVIISANCALAPFITPCHTQNDTCTLAAAQAALPYVAAGLPELGVKPLDPLHIPVIKSDQGGLTLTFTDTVITGLKNCKIDGIRHDITKPKQSVVIRCSINQAGNYKLNGRLIVLPVEGEGKYNIDIRDIVIKVTSEMSMVPGEDGKLHWHVNKWKHAYQVKTGAHFQFDNLFNGNKVLAEPVEMFMNTNWSDVMQEVAPPVVYSIVAAVMDTLEALYKIVPADELALS
ncbi:circadian clock-controlled protein daywake-like [Galleria mellonella]|uniref:Circadian clock-controlled protein daywake-like n=1 Tax=Galleria mellonella TaxID=7137 RepID=A0A6J1WQX3_GALME|nr:circadian clock-controlled protein daywake-like [Galleria mellonella]